MGYAGTASPMAPVNPGHCGPRLSTVVYRSRAIRALSDRDLRSLLRTAQARNHREAITGVVLYDDSRFFQWLEGPPDGVERVMSSIRHDQRHTDLEVLVTRESSARRFDGWDMKLAARGADTTVWQGELLEPPREIIEDLRRKPAAAPKLLAKLLPPQPLGKDPAVAASLDGATLSKTTASILKAVFLDSVIPVLLCDHGLPGSGTLRPPINPRATELAELLLAPDEAASLDLIRELRGQSMDVRHLYGPLLEPAARSLGDLSREDICSEFDVTLGLIRLQTAARLLSTDAAPLLHRGGAPRVMVVPAPGELHQLVAGLDTEWLWRAGWSPRSEFPSSDQALADLLSSAWVDVLDLSLSAALHRPDSLKRLRKTIVRAREASMNPALFVVVGGRIFAEGGIAGSQAGANAASTTSVGIDRLMLKLMFSLAPGTPASPRAKHHAAG